MITSVNGNFEKTYDDVLWFWAVNSKFIHFPQNLTRFFKNVDYIHINAHIKNISKSDLEPFGSQLDVLNLPSNSIEIIDADLFDSNPNLSSISLSGNPLKIVAKGAFDKLEKLNTLSVSENFCFSGHKDSYREYGRSAVLNLITLLETNCYERNETTIEQLVKIENLNARLNTMAKRIAELEGKNSDLKEKAKVVKPCEVVVKPKSEIQEMNESFIEKFIALETKIDLVKSSIEAKIDDKFTLKATNDETWSKSLNVT